MTAMRAAFGAWFSRSALLDVRGPGIAWLMYAVFLLMGVIETVTARQNGVVLFWAVVVGTVFAQSFTIFLHRLTTGVPANIVPGYRRHQWRAFALVVTGAIACDAVLFYLGGLKLAEAVSVALAVIGVSIWLSQWLRYGALVLLAVAGIIIWTDAFAEPFVAAVGAYHLWPLSAALAGVLALWAAARRYLAGAPLKIGIKFDRTQLLGAEGCAGIDWQWLDPINHWLFARVLRTADTSVGKSGNIAAACFTPVWSSGIASALQFILFSVFMGLLDFVMGDHSPFQSALIAGYLFACLFPALFLSGRFQAQRQLWAQLWMALPADDRRAFTMKLARAYLLAQLRCYLPVVVLLVVASAVSTAFNAGELAALVIGGLDVIFIGSAMTLLLLPYGRLTLLLRWLGYAAVWITAVPIGAGVAYAFLELLPPTGRIVAGLIAIGGWALLLIRLSFRRLQRTQLAVRDAGALNTFSSLGI